MRFTPGCNVVYHGVMHRAGTSFEIDPADAGEMRLLGAVQSEERRTESGEKTPVEAVTSQEDGGEKKAAQKGRPKKK